MRKTVVVFGKGQLAIAAAEWFECSSAHDIVMTVPVMPEPNWCPSFRQWSLVHGVPFVSSGDFKALSKTTRFDLAVSVFYDKIFTPEFINRCGRIINHHNAPLPRYRGVSPINWALKNREPTHGVTIHEITPGIDDGPIIAQVIYPLYPDIEEVADAYERSIEYGRVLLLQTLAILDKLEARPQNDNEASYYDSQQNDQLGNRRYFTQRETGPRK